MATPNQIQTFRFLDLPIELRLMIYENLLAPTGTKVYDIATATGATRMILTMKSFPTALLATCTFIHQEAAPILHKAVREHQPVVTFVDAEDSALEVY